MPKIQTFVSSAVEEEINNIVSEKKMEGANHFEANQSNTTSMLIELGLRVYKLQKVKKEGGFSQIKFNKVMLENMMKSSLINQKLLRMTAKNAELQGQGDFNLGTMSSQIKTGVDSMMHKFFPADEDVEE